MSKIGAYEAKTHLPKLLERVEAGERFVITRHGRAVAELIPIRGPDAKQVQGAFSTFREARARFAKRGIKLKPILRKTETLRDLAHAGHRY